MTRQSIHVTYAEQTVEETAFTNIPMEIGVATHKVTKSQYLEMLHINIYNPKFTYNCERI